MTILNVKQMFNLLVLKIIIVIIAIYVPSKGTHLDSDTNAAPVQKTHITLNRLIILYLFLWINVFRLEMTNILLDRS